MEAQLVGSDNFGTTNTCHPEPLPLGEGPSRDVSKLICFLRGFLANKLEFLVKKSNR